MLCADVMAIIRGGHGQEQCVSEGEAGGRNCTYTHRPRSWVLEEASVESCMLDARLLAEHREASPCLITHCLPQLTV